MRVEGKGGFPLSRIFYVHTHVNLTRVNKTETMYGRSGLNGKVKPRTEKLRDSGNQP